MLIILLPSVKNATFAVEVGRWRQCAHPTSTYLTQGLGLFKPNKQVRADMRRVLA